MRQLFRFMHQHGSHLGFGAILMAMSSFGQTYFVSLYGQDLRQAFSLSDGGLGGLYAIGTVMSAITLIWAGRLIDYITTIRFTLAVTLLLTVACLLVSGAQAPWMLCAGFYLLWLLAQATGQRRERNAVTHCEITQRQGREKRRHNNYPVRQKKGSNYIYTFKFVICAVLPPSFLPMPGIFAWPPVAAAFLRGDSPTPHNAGYAVKSLARPCPPPQLVIRQFSLEEIN